MKQLDFSGIDVVRTAERERRHDAFWGQLNETRRTAARVACDFFAFVGEVNWQLAQHSRLAASDAEKAMEAFIMAQMFSKVAVEKFRLFGRITGCGDDAEAIERLERLVAHSRNTGWQICPGWWTKDPAKNTAYFIGQLKVHAGQYVRYLAMRREAAEAKGNGRKKGGAL